MYPQSMFLSKNKKNIKTNHLKIIIFTAVKYCCILHGHVCVMHVHIVGHDTLYSQRKLSGFMSFINPDSCFNRV